MYENEIPVGKAENLIGRRFNKLIVLCRVKSSDRKTRWLCQCDCGNTTIVRTDFLKSGHTTSCGCNYSPDLTGQTFGRLTVIEKYGTINRELYWTCKCSCGNVIQVRGVSLKKGDTQSCGCFREESLQNRAYDLTGQKFGKLTALYPTDKRHCKSIIWHCKCDCGNECDVNGANLRTGKTQSCGCLLSKGELAISTILRDNNIDFSTQQIFHNLVDEKTGNPLRFDFYIEENYLIEFDGQQHFFPIEIFGGQEQFEIQKERDMKKNKWCEENHIPLIRIPYTKFNTLCIEDLLLESTQFRVV